MVSTEWRTDQSIKVEPIECSAERCLTGGGVVNIGKVGSTLRGDRLLLPRSIPDSAWFVSLKGLGFEDFTPSSIIHNTTFGWVGHYQRQGVKPVNKDCGTGQ